MKKLLVGALLCLMSTSTVWAQEKGQQTFQTPDQAAKALLVSVKAQDVAGLTRLVGSNTKAVLFSGDAKADAASHASFVKAGEEKMQLVPIDDSLIMLVVGKDNYPCPVPLVQKNKVWYFDGELALQEVLARRVGQNELAAIRTCEAYVQAQREFLALDADDTGIAQYAQRFASNPGKHDGLYWPVTGNQVPSPIGPFLARTDKDSKSPHGELQGYHYRILTGQGPAAPGGAHSYVIDGNMVAGFGLVAYPVEYRNTGVMTFILGPSGTLYQRDLKDQTAKMGADMQVFDPGPGWEKL